MHCTVQGGDMKSAVPKVADALAKTTMATVALSGEPGWPGI